MKPCAGVSRSSAQARTSAHYSYHSHESCRTVGPLTLAQAVLHIHAKYACHQVANQARCVTEHMLRQGASLLISLLIDSPIARSPPSAQYRIILADYQVGSHNEAATAATIRSHCASPKFIQLVKYCGTRSRRVGGGGGMLVPAGCSKSIVTVGSSPWVAYLGG